MPRMKCWGGVLSTLGKSNYCPLPFPCERDCAALLIWAMVFGLDGVAHVCGSCFFASETGLAISSCLTN